jgi:predicted TPR repeat methyltransferase
MAADVLCYFGELEGVFTAAHRALRGGGWLLFSVEALADPESTPHRLMPSGRYVHHATYLRDTLRAAGFDDPRLQGETLRAETGAPVKGWVVSARKPRPT